jgi:hypothetical protein
VQVLFATIDNADLPDQQYLRRVLQMRLVRALKITDKLIPGVLPNWSIIDSTGIGVIPRRSLKRLMARRESRSGSRNPTTNTTASVASIIQTMRSP